ERGRKTLEKGGSALDAVTLCVKLLEDNPLFNAGCGAVANADGKYELDASIMNGKTLEAGAVAAGKNVKNPIAPARLVMEETDHVLLSGRGAIEFAHDMKVKMVTPGYFKNAEAQAKKIIQKSRKHGTVGAVARDKKGNLAAATSTGGRKGKMPG